MPMDSSRIEELLARYWNCESSIEEEQELRECFSQGGVPEGFREAAQLFEYFNAQRGKALHDVAFDNELLTRIRPRNKAGTRRWLYNSMRIAAGVIVLMAAVWFVRLEIRKSTPPELVDTYNDPQLAFEETKKALLMISRSFGTAEEEARKINYFNEAQEKIQGEAGEKNKN
jgi:hypothetical protein